MINIRKLNLNLLVALDALLSERSVSRAAKKNFLTQSALSSSLKQLRKIFNDDLLLWESRAMKLTPFAVKLAPRIKQILEQIQMLDENDKFNPLISEREFNLYISEYVEFAVLPFLYEYLIKHAPKIKLNIKRFPESRSSYFDTEIDELYLGPIDTEISAKFQRKKLFEEPLVLVGKKNHPLMKGRMTLENYMQAKYILCKRINTRDLFKEDLVLNSDKLQLPTKHVTTVVYISTAIYLVKKTDCLTILPMRLASHFISKTKLACRGIPFITQKINVFQAWPRHLNNDQGLCWLRESIDQAVKKAEENLTLP